MLKKISAIILLLSAAVSLYAGSSIGVSIAPDWNWSGSESGSTDFLFTADGANYFGDIHGIGPEYGIGVVFPLNTWEDGRTESASGSPYGFAFRIGLGYRYDTEDVVGIFIGAGIRGKLQMYNDRPLPDQSTRLFSLDVYGRAGVDFSIMNVISISLGVMAGGPVYSNATLISGGASLSSDYQRDGFFISPFVGAAILY